MESYKLREGGRAVSLAFLTHSGKHRPTYQRQVLSTHCCYTQTSKTDQRGKVLNLGERGQEASPFQVAKEGGVSTI